MKQKMLMVALLIGLSNVASATNYSCYVKYISWKNGDSVQRSSGYLGSVKASSKSEAERKAMEKMADIKDLPMSRMISAKCS